MDILADVLQQAGLKSRLLNHTTFAKGESHHFPCDKSMGLHLILSGEATITTKGSKEVLKLQKGDLAFMARARSHELKTTIGVTLVSGVYQLWNDPVHPMLANIPEWFIVKTDEADDVHQYQSVINLLASEVRSPKIGSASITHSLLDILFSYTFRKIIMSMDSSLSNWAYALNDQGVRKSLELLHADPSRDWTLEELARESGLSRAGLAKKFKMSLGDTPLHYLAVLRIQKAMNLLSTTSDNIDVVAVNVGYTDGFSFSKSFKKIAGLSPRDFRKQDQTKQGMRL